METTTKISVLKTFSLWIISISIQLNHRHSTQFVNNINIFKTSNFRYYPTTQLRCSLVKTIATSSLRNSSSKGITTHLEQFQQSFDGPSPDLINQRHRTSLFASLLLTPPLHPIMNSMNSSQVLGKPKPIILRLKPPCLKKNDTLCQRYRKNNFLGWPIRSRSPLAPQCFATE